MGKQSGRLLWLLILLSLCAVLGEVLITGDILLYLAPRMVPMAWFGLAVLIGLSIYQAYEIIRNLRDSETTGNDKLWILFFFVPIVLYLTVAPNATTPGLLPNQNVRMLSITADEPAGGSNAGTETNDVTPLTIENTISALPPCVLEEEQAIFDPSADRFVDYLQETADALAGKTITMYGFVYWDDGFPENTVLVSRLMVTCCAADAATVGFHVRVEPGANLNINDWIRVTGTIQSVKMLYYGSVYDFPVLTDGLILPCNAPDIEEAYIYP